MTTAPATVPMRQGTTYGANGMLKTEDANFYPPSPPVGGVCTSQWGLRTTPKGRGWIRTNR